MEPPLALLCCACLQLGACSQANAAGTFLFIVVLNVLRDLVKSFVERLLINLAFIALSGENRPLDTQCNIFRASLNVKNFYRQSTYQKHALVSFQTSKVQGFIYIEVKTKLQL